LPRRPGLALLLPLALLAACDTAGPDGVFKTYLERLSRTLEVGSPNPGYREFPRPPRPGSLQLALDADSLGGLDFLALSGCAVQVTIGRRNSSLGRVAPPSQRLLLALEYLRLAPACVEKLKTAGRTELARTLDRAWQLKRRQLPRLIFNATLGSEEYRAFWQAAATPGGFPAVSASTAEQALSAINGQARRWLGGDFTADGRAFEVMLGEAAGGGGGRLLMDLSRQSAWLAAADQLIDMRMARGPLCSTGFRHAAADVLPRVVEKFFIADIQAQGAVMYRRSFQLYPPIEELEQLLYAVLPDNYLAWQTEREQLLGWANAAPRRHVEKLKTIQAPCN